MRSRAMKWRTGPVSKMQGCLPPSRRPRRRSAAEFLFRCRAGRTSKLDHVHNRSFRSHALNHTATQVGMQQAIEIQCNLTGARLCGCAAVHSAKSPSFSNCHHLFSLHPGMAR